MPLRHLCRRRLASSYLRVPFSDVETLTPASLQTCKGASFIVTTEIYKPSLAKFHSPAAVLGWVKGMQPEPDLVYHVFSAICETRTLTKAGYAKFRNFLLYGEQGLAGKKALINIFQDVLTLEYGEHPLSRYSVEWQPNDTHLLRVGNPRLYDHPYHSPQLQL